MLRINIFDCDSCNAPSVVNTFQSETCFIHDQTMFRPSVNSLSFASLCTGSCLSFQEAQKRTEIKMKLYLLHYITLIHHITLLLK